MTGEKFPANIWLYERMIHRCPHSVLYQITDSVCIVGAGQVGGVRRRRGSDEGERGRDQKNSSSHCWLGCSSFSSRITKCCLSYCLPPVKKREIRLLKNVFGFLSSCQITCTWTIVFRLWKCICIFYAFYLFLSQKSKHSLVNKNLKWGQYHYEIKKILNTPWIQLLAPLEIPMSKISLILIHIHNFEHSRVIMKISSHGFLFHRNINSRENKAQINLIIHHNDTNQRIYFWCAAKDNWASQILCE